MPARTLAPILLALCLGGAAWPAPAWAAPKERLTGYGDLRFGMSVAEAAAAIGEAQPAPPADGIELIETPVVVAGMPALRQLLFAGGRLASIVFRWAPAQEPAADAASRCRALFARLQGQLGGRYGTPALGPDQSPEGEPGFAGMTFWSFADGASIALVVAEIGGGQGEESQSEESQGGGSPCQATLNYKQPPTGDGE
jgi:hypothetical protein